MQRKQSLFVSILMLVDNVDSFNALEKKYYPEHFEPGSPSFGKSRNFCRIANGKRRLGKKTMQRVLKRHPRAAHWLALPLWEVCAGPVDNERIEELLLASDISLTTPKLFHRDRNDHLTRRKGRAFNLKTYIRYLVVRPSWKSFSILLLLAIENNNKGLAARQDACFKAAYFVFITLLAKLSLARQKVLRDLGEYLHRLITKRFRHFFNDSFPMDHATSKELIEFFPVFERYLNQSQLIRKYYNEIPLCKHRYNFFLLPPKQQKSVMDEIQTLISKGDFSALHFTQRVLVQNGVFTIKRRCPE